MPDAKGARDKVRWHVPGRIFATNKRKKHGGEGLGKSGKFRELTDRLSYHHSCELFWSLKRHEWPKKDSRAVLGVLLPDKSRHERDKARDSNRESQNHVPTVSKFTNSASTQRDAANASPDCVQEWHSPDIRDCLDPSVLGSRCILKCKAQECNGRLSRLSRTHQNSPMNYFRAC